MRSLLGKVWKEEVGQDTAEYALLLLMIALALIISVQAFQTAIANAFSRAGGQLSGSN